MIKLKEINVVDLLSESNILASFISGGHMLSTFSSSAPEFWNHHSMLDCIWDAWQQKGEEYKNIKFDKKSDKLLGFMPIEYKKLYIDNENLAGCGIKIKCQSVIPRPP